jgi:putative peptidoglycan lipid II flippase
MVAFLWLLMGPYEQWLQWTTLQRSWHLAGLVAGGAGVYLGVLLLAGLRPRHLRGARF